MEKNELQIKHENYEKAYKYYCESRARNGNPPAVNLSQYKNMVPYSQVLEMMEFIK